MTREQMTLHERNADAQKEQGDSDGADDDPPEARSGQRYKELESPPEKHLAKIIGMP